MAALEHKYFSEQYARREVRQLVEQVRLGAIPSSRVQSGPGLSGIAPLAGIQQIPYAFKTEKQAVDAHFGEFGDLIRNEIALKSGFRVFPVIFALSFRQITSSTHPIRTAEDLVGFKLRAPPGNLFVEVYKQYGAVVASLSLADVYPALQTHLIDGADNTATATSRATAFTKVQKYLSVMDSLWGGIFLYCNGDAWRALTIGYSGGRQPQRDDLREAGHTRQRRSQSFYSGQTAASGAHSQCCLP